MGIPFPFPLAALPSPSLSHTCCAVTPRQLCCSLCCAGALTLLQSLSQPPALFLSVVISSVSWSEHAACAAWGPHGDNLPHKSVQYRSRSFQSIRTIPRPHQEPPSSQLPPGTRGLSAKLLHKTNNKRSALGVWGSNYFRGSTGIFASLGGLENTLEHMNQPLTWIQGLQCKVIVGESKRGRAASSSTTTCLSVPPKCPKVPFNNSFPTSSIFTRKEVTWESSCSSTWKCWAHGENTAVRACTLSLTPATRAFWQTTNPRFNLPLYILALVLQILAQFLRLFFSKPNACQTCSAWAWFLLGLWLILIFKNREVGTSWLDMKLLFKHAEKAKLPKTDSTHKWLSEQATNQPKNY